MTTTPAAATHEERTANPLRPGRLRDMIGQEQVKGILRRVIDRAVMLDVPLGHVLLVGPSGTGKSTVSNVIANELGVRCFQVEAPVSSDTLLDLREVMRPNDILFIDEIHQQAIMERRGRQSSTQPEVLFQVLEDRIIVTPTGVLPYPHITVIGATTDEGMLPDPFINRFPLRPVLEPYSEDELTQIAEANADALGVRISYGAALAFARASRAVPRQINNYVSNGAMLGDYIDDASAQEVLQTLNRVTGDGLTLDMQRMLTFLYTRAKRTNGEGEVTYQASVNTIATAIGKSRDTKAIALRVEPFLIERGFIQVGHGGRRLTDLGIERAQQLLATT